MSQARDRHAEERERKSRKQRYGMRVSGRSVRLLGRLSARPKKRAKRKKRSG